MLSLTGSLQEMPLRRKLMLVVMLSTSIALLFAALLSTVQQWFIHRNELINTVTSQANIISINSANAILSGDKNSAKTTLEALSAIDYIEFAMLHDKSGKSFAIYVRGGGALPPQHHTSDGERYIFSAAHLDAFIPVVFNDEKIATVHVHASLLPLYEQIAEGVLGMLLAALGGLVVAYVLIARMSPSISGPIENLAGLIRSITREKNYALRSVLHNKDEVGALADGFNNMLEQIQARDSMLEQHRATLEREVAQRTSSLTEAQRIAHLGNWEWDIVQDKLTWSDEIYHIFGLAPQQFGANYEAFMQAVYPEDRQHVEKQIREALEQMCPYSIEHRILRPDGSVRYVRERGEVFCGEDGKPARMLGTVHDVTENWLIETALVEKEKQFRELVEQSSDWIWEVNAQAIYSYVSPQCKSILGYEVEEVVGKSPFDLMPREEAQRVSAIFQKSLQEQQPFLHLESIHLHKDGHQVVLETNGVPIFGLNGEFIGYRGMNRDVTERKLMERELRQSEARYRGIFEHTDDMIFLLAPDGTFNSLSPSFERLTGWRVAEWIGKPFALIIHPDDLPRALEIFQNTVAGQSMSSFELRVAKKPGEYFDAELSVVPAPLGGEIAVIGIARDVTERKQIEEKIRRLNEELEAKVQERTKQLQDAQEELVRKEKLSVLGQVAGSVGHELRNPLGVMSNAVYFLQAVLPDADETTKEYLGIIKNEIGVADRIVGDLLDSVRTKPPQPQRIGLAELIAQTLLKCDVPANVSVQQNTPDALAPLWVDPLQIGQVFRNLFSNGIEAMPQGGTLAIRASANPSAQSITISVQDSGSGIAPEVLSKLFQPLFTTKARGIGLGLVVVKNLTRNNGGKIEVTSEPGKGTTFTITLPSST